MPQDLRLVNKLYFGDKLDIMSIIEGKEKELREEERRGGKE